MRVEELMNDAQCCREGDSVRDCARVMKEEDIGFVPICNASGVPVGAVTDRDLAIRILGEGRTADEMITSVMTRDVVSCRIGDDVRDAERLMREHRTSRVMICDAKGKLQGVISLVDLIDVETDEEAGETLHEVKSDQPSAH